MDVMSRIERALTTALARGDHPGCPPKLVAAMRHAVFPRGARIRPRLCLAVAAACGEDAPGVSDSAGAAIELLHCALPRARRPAVLRRRGHAPRPALGALRVRRAAGRAGGGCADRARVPDPGHGRRRPPAAARPVAGHGRRVRRRAVRDRRRAGLGMRGGGRPRAIPAREDGRPVRRRHRRRGRRRRRGVRAVARDGHVAGRGVPGRRRYPGTPPPPARRWASRSGRTAPTPARVP